MNQAAKIVADAAPIPTAIAGEQALCDHRGVLYLPAMRLMVVSDLHLEKGSSLARRGTLVPPYDTAATLARLAETIAHYRPETVVSLGDSFHDGEGAARMPDAFRDRLVAMMEGRRWFWIAGNHDPLPPDGVPGRTVDQLAVGGLLFRHEPAPGARVGEIAGHLHPGARVVRRGRSVRRACFVGDGTRLIMPAFGAFTGMLNVLDDAFDGLFSAERMVAYVLGRERVYAVAWAQLRRG
ncbi:ligase-associated DNA damage response endonuclease PdeM [Mesorhizobium xinjiangense]|uniref:ligase-associated DNA damage response endonuclease PdeM n=1 Tax=Mesorhizobium xinjiangense TaxID=2678685 RepID=UPI0012EDF30D|nr:ligase-associated DNA damage response endonuclease PdeM [Mesorhizobium xinjiangense]